MGNHLHNITEKYQAIVENIREDENGDLRATREISTNSQIFIISTANIMSSEEEYQFKDFFSKNDKEKLAGRLLIERFLGNNSYYYEYLNSLPKPNELEDYYHFTEYNKEELKKRSLISYNWNDRKEEYEALNRKIPTNVNILLTCFRSFLICF